MINNVKLKLINKVIRVKLFKYILKYTYNPCARDLINFVIIYKSVRSLNHLNIFYNVLKTTLKSSGIFIFSAQKGGLGRWVV